MARLPGQEDQAANGQEGYGVWWWGLVAHAPPHQSCALQLLGSPQSNRAWPDAADFLL